MPKKPFDQALHHILYLTPWLPKADPLLPDYTADLQDEPLWLQVVDPECQDNIYQVINEINHSLPEEMKQQLHARGLNMLFECRHRRAPPQCVVTLDAEIYHQYLAYLSETVALARAPSQAEYYQQLFQQFSNSILLSHLLPGKHSSDAFNNLTYKRHPADRDLIIATLIATKDKQQDVKILRMCRKSIAVYLKKSFGRMATKRDIMVDQNAQHLTLSVESYITWMQVQWRKIAASVFTPIHLIQFSEWHTAFGDYFVTFCRKFQQPSLMLFILNRHFGRNIFHADVSVTPPIIFVDNAQLSAEERQSLTICEPNSALCQLKQWRYSPHDYSEPRLYDLSITEQTICCLEQRIADRELLSFLLIGNEFAAQCKNCENVEGGEKSRNEKRYYAAQGLARALQCSDWNLYYQPIYLKRHVDICIKFIDLIQQATCYPGDREQLCLLIKHFAYPFNTIMPIQYDSSQDTIFLYARGYVLDLFNFNAEAVTRSDHAQAIHRLISQLFFALSEMIFYHFYCLSAEQQRDAHLPRPASAATFFQPAGIATRSQALPPVDVTLQLARMCPGLMKKFVPQDRLYVTKSGIQNAANGLYYCNTSSEPDELKPGTCITWFGGRRQVGPLLPEIDPTHCISLGYRSARNSMHIIANTDPNQAGLGYFVNHSTCPNVVYRTARFHNLDVVVYVVYNGPPTRLQPGQGIELLANYGVEAAYYTHSIDPESSDTAYEATVMQIKPSAAQSKRTAALLVEQRIPIDSPIVWQNVSEFIATQLYNHRQALCKIWWNTKQDFLDPAQERHFLKPSKLARLFLAWIRIGYQVKQRFTRTWHNGQDVVTVFQGMSHSTFGFEIRKKLRDQLELLIQPTNALGVSLSLEELLSCVRLMAKVAMLLLHKQSIVELHRALINLPRAINEKDLGIRYDERHNEIFLQVFDFYARRTVHIALFSQKGHFSSGLIKHSSPTRLKLTRLFCMLTEVAVHVCYRTHCAMHFPAGETLAVKRKKTHFPYTIGQRLYRGMLDKEESSFPSKRPKLG